MPESFTLFRHGFAIRRHYYSLRPLFAVTNPVPVRYRSSAWRSDCSFLLLMIIKLAQHILDVRQINNSELQATIIYIIKKQCYKSKNKNPVYRRFICGPFFQKNPVQSLSISGLLIIFRKFIICPMETVLMTENGLYRECFLVLIRSSSERFSFFLLSTSLMYKASNRFGAMPITGILCLYLFPSIGI